MGSDSVWFGDGHQGSSDYRGRETKESQGRVGQLDNWLDGTLRGPPA
jgi:hypothetical protein